jgi:DHA2 family lincomycin resistance protein-like MFS transporter
MALMGVVILLPLFLQDVRGLTTLQTGLLLMPGGLVMGLLGPVVGRLYDRVGARTLVLPGAVVVLLCLAGTAYAVQAAPWWAFLVLHVLLCVGLAFMFTPTFTLGLGSLPPHLYAHGSALLGTVQQVAAAAGTALVITIMATRAATLELGGTAELPALAGGVQLAVAAAAVLALVVLGLALLLPRAVPARDSHGIPVVE